MTFKKAFEIYESWTECELSTSPSETHLVFFSCICVVSITHQALGATNLVFIAPVSTGSEAQSVPRSMVYRQILFDVRRHLAIVKIRPLPACAFSSAISGILWGQSPGWFHKETQAVAVTPEVTDLSRLKCFSERSSPNCHFSCDSPASRHCAAWCGGGQCPSEPLTSHSRRLRRR